VATAYTRLIRQRLSDEEAAEQVRVDALAQSLIKHLDIRESAITAVHVHRAPSSAVQEIVSELLQRELGFSEEKRLTAQFGLVTAARPDFIFQLAAGRGILAEVERGGTTTNNHDLKDFWKTHVAPDAHHLFLVVPNANWKEAGTARERPFPLVSRRLGAFFGDARREVDVQSTHIFGYGETGQPPH
jgi:hypothetical protein